MARLIMKPTLSLIVLSFFLISIISTFPTITDAKKQSSYVKTLNPKTLTLGMKKEKLTHFRVYWQDVASGPNATLTQITKAANGSSTFFGATFMIDDALTVGPELNSTLVGRAQGLYASSGQKQIGLSMAMNFLFLEGKYNGSTISIFGRNKVFGVREMPIVGGSGLFRFARGYVEARTYTANFTTGDATVEYNVYVLHY